MYRRFLGAPPGQEAPTADPDSQLAEMCTGDAILGDGGKNAPPPSCGSPGRPGRPGCHSPQWGETRPLRGPPACADGNGRPYTSRLAANQGLPRPAPGAARPLGGRGRSGARRRRASPVAAAEGGRHASPVPVRGGGGPVGLGEPLEHQLTLPSRTSGRTPPHMAAPTPPNASARPSLDAKPMQSIRAQAARTTMDTALAAPASAGLAGSASRRTPKTTRHTPMVRCGPSHTLKRTRPEFSTLERTMSPAPNWANVLARVRISVLSEIGVRISVLGGTACARQRA